MFGSHFLKMYTVSNDRFEFIFFSILCFSTRINRKIGEEDVSSKDQFELQTVSDRWESRWKEYKRVNLRVKQ